MFLEAIKCVNRCIEDLNNQPIPPVKLQPIESPEHRGNTRLNTTMKHLIDYDKEDSEEEYFKKLKTNPKKSKLFESSDEDA